MAAPSILLIADAYVPVPPVTYGGIERIVDFLAEGLASKGWDVTLACDPESTCKVRTLHHRSSQTRWQGRVINTFNLLRHVSKNHYDLIHSFAHFDLIAPLWPLTFPKIQSFQSPPDWTAINKRIRWIPKRNLHFTTCGRHMVEDFARFETTHAIHNAVRIEQFDFRNQIAIDAPLVFLGRIEPIKGTHTAIRIAQATGRRLIIAGNRSDKPDLNRYFIEEVEPHLSSRIEYVGPVNDTQKNTLLGGAAAFLMPIEWDEPFGIVMAEALACGTPVIGMARGALPEIVDHGITGACCQTIGEMIEAVGHVEDFSRHACRQSAESRFASDGIVEQYIALYESILDR